MSILIVLFGLLSDCLLSVLVGIIGSSRRRVMCIYIQVNQVAKSYD